jgi:aspartate carbamoyltransferase catalytic subunit
MSAQEDEETPWPHRHLLDLEGLTPAQIRLLLRTAHGFEHVSTRSVKKVPALRGRVVVNLFFEDSTRTRASFNLAASRMSADVLEMTGQGSSVSKGETLRDTARNIEAMGVDVLVCRHDQSGAARLLADSVHCSVLNAGDGRHEHPTQGLLDLYTLAQRLRPGAPSEPPGLDFSGLTVGIVGDVAHSRVARSGIHGLRKLGARVVLIGPPTLVPSGFRALGCEICHDFDEVLPELDAINMLRIQFERMQGQAFPSVREYAERYGLTAERFQRAKPHAVVMHPGPLNRGVEIDSAVADGPNSAILEQVTHGLAVRMASLFLVTQAADAAASETSHG